MFYGCKSLISLPDISIWNTSNVKSISGMFYGCNSLISLPDISKWNTSNVKDMSNLFSYCESLISLPDISTWNIFNVEDMSGMFYKCKFSTLPDFYNLYKLKNTIFFELTYKINGENRVKILDENFIENNKDKGSILYKDCKLELQEYLRVNDNFHNEIKFILCLDKHINDISYMFYECFSLISIENYIIKNQSYKINEEFDLMLNDSKVNNSKIHESDDSSNNFYGHSKYYISEVLTQLNQNNKNVSQVYENSSMSFELSFYNVNNMSSMFYECKSLISLPDISKWNTSNVNGMGNMFYGCNSLLSLPDISKWDTSNVEYMSYMFYRCISLISLPDISKWNTSNVKEMSYMFYKCNSLKSLPDISKWDTTKV